MTLQTVLPVAGTTILVDWAADVIADLTDHEDRVGDLEALVAADILLAVKTGDETVNNSATLQDDDHLSVTVAANSVYILRHEWVYNTGATPDLKSKFVVPSGTTMLYWTNASISTHAASAQTEASTVIYDGDGGDVLVTTVARVVTGSTAGTLKWQWAQNTANASNTVVRGAGILVLFKVS